MEYQNLLPPTDVSSFHVAPLSALVQMFPSLTPAANFVPSEELVMLHHFLSSPVDVTSVHVWPLSALVQRFPPGVHAFS